MRASAPEARRAGGLLMRPASGLLTLAALGALAVALFLAGTGLLACLQPSRRRLRHLRLGLSCRRPQQAGPPPCAVQLNTGHRQAATQTAPAVRGEAWCRDCS